MKKNIVITIAIVCMLFFSSCSNGRYAGKTHENRDYIRNHYYEFITFDENVSKNMGGHIQILFVPCGETTEQFISKVVSNRPQFYDASGNEITANQVISTGMVIKEPGLGSFLVIVKGDVNGDGKITEDDAKLAEKYAKGELRAPNSAYIYAADVDLSYSIDDFDVSSIRNEINSSAPGISWFNNLKEVKLGEFEFEFCSDLVDYSSLDDKNGLS